CRCASALRERGLATLDLPKALHEETEWSDAPCRHDRVLLRCSEGDFFQRQAGRLLFEGTPVCDGVLSFEGRAGLFCQAYYLWKHEDLGGAAADRLGLASRVLARIACRWGQVLEAAFDRSPFQVRSSQDNKKRSGSIARQV